MSSQRRRDVIKELVQADRLAYRSGKPRTSVPWQPFQSANADYWLQGWDAEERARLDEIADLKRDGQLQLLSAITTFGVSGDRAALVDVLLMIAVRLPPAVVSDT